VGDVGVELGAHALVQREDLPAPVEQLEGAHLSTSPITKKNDARTVTRSARRRAGQRGAERADVVEGAVRIASRHGVRSPRLTR
jgi:hypothetical protein